MTTTEPSTERCPWSGQVLLPFMADEPYGCDCGATLTIGAEHVVPEHARSVSDSDANHAGHSAAVVLLRSIVEEDPTQRSDEGLSDGCFFCGAGVRFAGNWADYVEHDNDCDWVQARALLGIPIAPHTVAPPEPPS